MDVDGRSILQHAGVSELGLSDHSLVYGVVKGDAVRKNGTVKMVRDFKKCSFERLVGTLRSAPWHDMKMLNGMDDKWTFWCEIFCRVVDYFAPLRKVRIRDKSLPWITQEVRALMRKRNFYLRKAQSSKGDEESWVRYKHLRDKVKEELRIQRSSYFHTVIESSKGNGRKKWEAVNQLLGTKYKRNIDIIYNGEEEISSSLEIARAFNGFFASSVGLVGCGGYDILRSCSSESVLNRDITQFKLRPIEESEVHELLLGLQMNKATGIDGISARILKQCADGIAGSLALLFNSSLRSCEVPTEWKSAVITPVLKKEPKTSLDNYRPVSVLPVVVKIFEKLIHRQLYDYLMENNILSANQFGFRPHHSTQDVLVSIVEKWRKSLDSDDLVGALFVDLSKAFDMVDHDILLRKLWSYGVVGDEHAWFRSYLVSNRRQIVRINKEVSDWTAVCRGVPQGSILGPLLFLIFVNDLSDAIPYGVVHQYADDIILTVVASDRTVLQSCLQMNLDAITNWVMSVKLCLNVKKTKMMLVARRRRQHELGNVIVTGENERLERSGAVRCLGVMIDDRLTWNDHVRELKRKASFGLSQLRRLRWLPTRLKCVLYSALVLSYFDYCSVVWMECSKRLVLELDHLQNKGMRIILGRSPRDSATEMRRDLGWTTLKVRRHLFRLRLVQRCILGCTSKCLASVISTNTKIGNLRTRFPHNCRIPPARTEAFRRSFQFQGSLDWNKLPESIKSSKSLLTVNQLKIAADLYL